ncbi:MAG: response regulator transcription factor [Pseudomonadota bacterium]
MKTNVIIADDHMVIREGIKSVIERKAPDIFIAGEAANGNEVLALAETSQIDMFMIDISMPGLNGIDTLHRLIEKDPRRKVIILSMHDDFNFVKKALRGGARGYLSKEDAIEEAVVAIRTVMAGKYFLSPGITGVLIQHLLNPRDEATGQKREIEELSVRENEILHLIAEGLDNKEIAARLFLSISTVHTHRQNIMNKLNLSRSGELIRYALQEAGEQKQL